jgi:predicted dehydrogenase
LAAGLDVLAEKPIAHTMVGQDALTRALADSGRYLQVAYMLRYHPFMQRIAALVASQQYGPLLSSTSYWGEYLPDWHPWEDYREGYAAKKSLGGGAALTLSHDLDLMAYLHGALAHSSITRNHSADLEVDVEAIADVQMAFANGSTAACHLSFADRFPRRSYRFVFDLAAIDIDYFAGQMQLQTASGTESIGLDGWERNDMFAAQWQHFCQQRLDTAANAQAQQNLAQAYQTTHMCSQT